MKSKQIAALLIAILAINLALALDQNLTIKEKAFNCIEESKATMAELEKAKFNIIRVNDSLHKAENLYQAQLVLELQKNNPDFSSVIPHCQEISNIRNQAYKVRDELYSALIFYNETSLKVNMSESDSLLEQINQEIQDERYEQALVLIEELNKEIIELQAQATRLNIFYEATSRGIKQFFMKNWIYIAAIVIILIILYFIYKKRIAKFLIKRKISGLELKKDTLKNLIKKTQYEYFQEGKIAEGIYNIRTKKFAELIRDVERQLPLLQEDLEKITHERVKVK
ncbi:MAG: hypothetical protein NT076_04385 [Candidatus Pacearchaeota archaeon]|nr:hypothetical protein [Candidatus Pacearchaeota archaeon]